MHSWRTSFPQVVHFPIFLCRHLFPLQNPESLPSTWCSEGKSYQTHSERHITTIQDHCSKSYYAVTCNYRDRITQTKSTRFLDWWKYNISRFPKPSKWSCRQLIYPFCYNPSGILSESDIIKLQSNMSWK